MIIDQHPDCPDCGGTGDTFDDWYCPQFGHYTRHDDCPTCKGAGVVAAVCTTEECFEVIEEPGMCEGCRVQLLDAYEVELEHIDRRLSVIGINPLEELCI